MRICFSRCTSLKCHPCATGAGFFSSEAVWRRFWTRKGESGDDRSSRGQCGMGCEGPAGTRLPQAMANSQESCSRQRLKQPDRNADATRRALAWIQSCGLYQDSSLHPDPQAFPSPMLDTFGLRGSNGRIHGVPDTLKPGDYEIRLITAHRSSGTKTPRVITRNFRVPRSK